jgi:hypothetical protein
MSIFITNYASVVDFNKQSNLSLNELARPKTAGVYNDFEQAKELTFDLALSRLNAQLKLDSPIDLSDLRIVEVSEDFDEDVGESPHRFEWFYNGKLVQVVYITCAFMQE